MIDSYVDATQHGYDEPLTDDLKLWIANGTDLENFTIDHITHLNALRSWLPYPTWRTPTPENLWLIGYPNAPALQPAGPPVLPDTDC
jgi:hypothetical protein